MKIITSAPAKLVLLGEYAVLEGAPALVMALNWRAEVIAQSQDQFKVTAKTLQLQDVPFLINSQGHVEFAYTAFASKDKLRVVQHVVAAAARLALQRGHVLKPCQLIINTDTFYENVGGAKLGVGSSAALSAALLLAVWAHAGLQDPFLPLVDETQRYALFETVHAAHAAAQGHVGSGVDVAASIWGGLLRYDPPKEERQAQLMRLPKIKNLTMLGVWTKTSAKTAPLIAQVQAFKKAQPQSYWEVLEKLAIYANAGTEFLSLNNLSAFMTMVDASYDALIVLGESAGANIVTPEHRDIYKHVRAAGGFYKSCGAGGGDVGVAFCASPQIAERVYTRLQNRGFTVFAGDMAEEGVACA